MNVKDTLKTILAGASVFGPIIVHSDKGLTILNASEELAQMVVDTHQKAHTAKSAPKK